MWQGDVPDQGLSRGQAPLQRLHQALQPRDNGGSPSSKAARAEREERIFYKYLGRH